MNLNTLLEANVGTSYASLVDSGDQGPQQTLAVLASASTGGVHEVGHATLGGAATTEYTSTIDVSKEAQATGKPALAPVLANLESKYHLSSFPISVWIDGQHRVRQVKEAITLAGTLGSPGGSVDITVGLSDFGVPVSVTPPAAGHVTDVTAEATSGASAST